MAMAVGRKHKFAVGKTFPTIGRCIYCGAKERLSDEHIIPYSLAGDYVFREASCAACAEITSREELWAARGVFGPLREAHGFPRRKRKNRKENAGIKVVVTAGGLSSEIIVPVDQAPTSPLFAPLFPPAGILVGRAPTLEIPGIAYLVILPHPTDHDERLKRFKGEGPTTISVNANWGLNNFMCLLAKIGHGFAVAGYGPDSFVPFLPNYILDRDRRLAHVIGGTDEAIAAPPPGTGLNMEKSVHAWSLGIRSVNGKHYVAVHMHLFRYLGYPVYEVIAGEASKELLARVL
jgi:hypothetical protein